MRKKIFKYIYITAIATFFIVALFCAYIGYLLVYNDAKDSLITYADSLVKDQTLLDEKGYEYLKLVDYRVTIINYDGNIIFDNKTQDKLASHNDRIEFINAKAVGSNFSMRFSDTLGQQHIYYAKVLDNGNVLRVSKSVDTIFSYINITVLTSLGFFLILAVIVIFIAGNLAFKVIEPLVGLNLDNINLDRVYDELKPLILKIKTQQEQIKSQFFSLKQQHNEIKTITNNMKEGLIVVNKDFNIISINKAALKFYKTQDNFVGKNLFELDDSPTIKKVFSKKNKISFVQKSVDITLHNRILTYYFNKIKVDDKIIGFAILIINVTAKKLAEKYRQEFSANVSHELKTPLQSIIGYAELIENQMVKTEDIVKFGANIKNQGNILLNLIDDIIFLSSLDEGNNRFADEVFSLRSMCFDIVKSVEIALNAKNIKIQIDHNDIVVKAIYRFFYELLYNLIDNAIKYNVEGGSIYVNLITTDKHYVIEVEDSGIGIASDDIERVFERFYRSSQPQVKKAKGTGLGLSIVKRVTIYYRGKIKVDSEVGKGTCINISFPINKFENKQ